MCMHTHSTHMCVCISNVFGRELKWLVQWVASREGNWVAGDRVGENIFIVDPLASFEFWIM